MIKDLEEEFEYLKWVLAEKLKKKELTIECLERVINQIHTSGQLIGIYKEKEYGGNEK